MLVQNRLTCRDSLQVWFSPYILVDEIAKQKAEVEMERAILLKNIEEHKKLEKQQEMEKLKVNHHPSI